MQTTGATHLHTKAMKPITDPTPGKDQEQKNTTEWSLGFLLFLRHDLFNSSQTGRKHVFLNAVLLRD